ncbi:MAG TPA: UDP-3-O-acyl-N-acetylglucosamine deacetylase [Dissulfurispiraceae bacterium]|nr:UDP-3-O-acyl-N-acetylglucosamine deacetylase [Dissulfurispiraceae bacterium]
MMRLQRTVKKEAFFHGIGLHTGKYATVRLKPAPRDTGIVFFRSDRDAIIRAGVNSVIDTAFATTLGYDGVKVRTVEHLLAAAAGLGIDNLFVDIDGPEVPVLDGSSTDLVSVLLEAGIAKQAKKISYVRITAPVAYEDSHCRIVALPYDGRRFSYFMSFSHKFLGNQDFSVDMDEANFAAQIAPARTFGFLKDLERLRANGLARGGSLDNAVVVGDDGILNASGLRFTDEFVRHKILDAIGDFSLIGMPIEGHIVMEKSGHSANVHFLKRLLLSPDCYQVVSEVDQPDLRVLNYT